MKADTDAKQLRLLLSCLEEVAPINEGSFAQLEFGHYCESLTVFAPGCTNTIYEVPSYAESTNDIKQVDFDADLLVAIAKYVLNDNDLCKNLDRADFNYVRSCLKYLT